MDFLDLHSFFSMYTYREGEINIEIDPDIDMDAYIDYSHRINHIFER